MSPGDALVDDRPSPYHTNDYNRCDNIRSRQASFARVLKSACGPSSSAACNDRRERFHSAICIMKRGAAITTVAGLGGRFQLRGAKFHHPRSDRGLRLARSHCKLACVMRPAARRCEMQRLGPGTLTHVAAGKATPRQRIGTRAEPETWYRNSGQWLTHATNGQSLPQMVACNHPACCWTRPLYLKAAVRQISGCRSASGSRISSCPARMAHTCA